MNFQLWCFGMKQDECAMSGFVKLSYKPLAAVAGPVSSTI